MTLPRALMPIIAAALAVSAAGCTAGGSGALAAAASSPHTAAPEPTLSIYQGPPHVGVTSVPAPSATATVTAPAATFLPVTVDGWRYGVAWVGFTVREDKGTFEDPVKPGWVVVSFTTEIQFADHSRPSEPWPNVLWVGLNLGWGFYVANERLAAERCPDTYRQRPCEVTMGSVYSGCSPSPIGMPPAEAAGTVFTETCESDTDFPKGATVHDFRVIFGYKAIADDGTTTDHTINLPYEG